MTFYINKCAKTLALAMLKVTINKASKPRVGQTTCRSRPYQKTISVNKELACVVFRGSMYLVLNVIYLDRFCVAAVISHVRYLVGM